VRGPCSRRRTVYRPSWPSLEAADANAQDCARCRARQGRRCRSGHHGPSFR
jgi:hypothetical protein